MTSCTTCAAELSGSLGKEPYVDTQTNGCGVHHPRQLSTADDADGEASPTGHPPKRTGHYDGQPCADCRSSRLCRVKSWLLFAVFYGRRGERSGGAAHEAAALSVMRLRMLAHLERHLPKRRKRSGCPSECTGHCSLKITERCTMKLTVVAIPWAITNAMIWTENGSGPARSTA